MPCSTWQLANTSMEFTYLIKQRVGKSADEKVPRSVNLPQPFEWRSDVIYTINGSSANVKSPAEWNPTSDDFQEPEDFTNVSVSYMSVADASPAKKQKK